MLRIIEWEATETLLEEQFCYSNVQYVLTNLRLTVGS